MINWKLRFKNPMFWVQVGLSILVPILGYYGIEAKDLTTWKQLGDTLMNAVSNPYVISLIAVSLYNAVIDPTTKGIEDSNHALDKTTLK